MFFLRTLFPLVAVLTVIWPTSQVQAKVPESPFSLCSQFRPEMTEADIEWLRWRLRESFPAQYLPLLESIKIIEVDNDELLGPRYLPGTEPRVELPRRFYIRQCVQVLFETLHDAKPEADYSSVITGIDECVAQGGGRASCLEQELTAYLITSRANPELSSIMASQKAVALNTFGAATFLVAHEAGHAVLRGSLTPEELMDTDEELEADVLALQSFLQSYSIPVGPAFSLAAVSLAEPDDPFFAVTHEPARCRYERVRQLVDAVWRPVLTVEAITKRGSGYSRKELADFAQNYALDVLLKPSEQEQCSDVDHAALEAARMDIEDAVSIVASFKPGELRDNEVERYLTKLEQLQPRTRLGLHLRAQLSYLAISRSQSFAALSSANAQQSMGEYLVLMDRLLALADGYDNAQASPDTQSMLEYVRVLRANFSQPRGSGIRANARRTMAGLDRVFALQEPEEALRRKRYAEQQSHGLAQIDTTFLMSAVELYTQQQIILGDCADPALQSSLLYPRAMLAAGKVPQTMTPQQCRNFKLGSIMQMERNLGWQWDGPPLQPL